MSEVNEAEIHRIDPHRKSPEESNHGFLRRSMRREVWLCLGRPIGEDQIRPLWA